MELVFCCPECEDGAVTVRVLHGADIQVTVIKCSNGCDLRESKELDDLRQMALDVEQKLLATPHRYW